MKAYHGLSVREIRSAQREESAAAALAPRSRRLPPSGARPVFEGTASPSLRGGGDGGYFEEWGQLAGMGWNPAIDKSRRRALTQLRGRLPRWPPGDPKL